MNRSIIDELDSKILGILTENARKPFLEIARECGVSGAAVHQRIQRLCSAGVIEGYNCKISPESIGYETCAYVGINLKNPSDYNDVVEKLKQIQEVVECHFTTGQFDVYIKIMARNNDHLLHLLQNEIQALDTSRTETLISFKEVFNRPVPLPEYDKD